MRCLIIQAKELNIAPIFVLRVGAEASAGRSSSTRACLVRGKSRPEPGVRRPPAYRPYAGPRTTSLRLGRGLTPLRRVKTISSRGSAPQPTLSPAASRRNSSASSAGAGAGASSGADAERAPKTGSGGVGTGRSVSGGILPARANARVAAEPPLRSAMVTVPAASASATQRRPAASKARRQASRQKRCALPASRRGSKLLPHHRHAPAVEFSGMLLPVAALCDERLLSEPTAVAHPCLREPLFMPHTCRSRYPPGSAQLGGEQTFGPSTARDRRWKAKTSNTIALLCRRFPKLHSAAGRAA